MWKLVQNKVSITFFSIKIYAKFFGKKIPVFLFTDCHLLLWILPVTPQLPRETKTKFLLTISMQHQQTSDENKEKYQLGVIG